MEKKTSTTSDDTRRVARDVTSSALAQPRQGERRYASPLPSPRVSQVVRVILRDFQEILHANVRHEVEELHLGLAPANLDGAILEDLRDAILIEPVPVRGDALRDDAREGNVVLGVLEEEVPAGAGVGAVQVRRSGREERGRGGGAREGSAGVDADRATRATVRRARNEMRERTIR